MTIIKGSFTSEWDEGPITTNCTLDTETGELFPESMDIGDTDMGSLISEKFEADNGDEYKVCTVCHEYIKKGKMVPNRTGKELYEEQQCMNPDCESHDE